MCSMNRVLTNCSHLTLPDCWPEVLCVRLVCVCLSKSVCLCVWDQDEIKSSIHKKIPAMYLLFSSTLAWQEIFYCQQAGGQTPNTKYALSAPSALLRLGEESRMPAERKGTSQGQKKGLKRTKPKEELGRKESEENKQK